MPRQTLAEFKTWFSSDAVLNLSVTDPRWLQYLNQALERLMMPGMWVGTTGRYAIQTRSACLTWPRSFVTIEAMAVCDQPVPIRNQWFEFLEAGPGKQHILGRGSSSFGQCGARNVLASFDRGSGYAMFDDLCVPSVVRLYPSLAVDEGKAVTLRGWDYNGNEVLTDNGNMQGETVELALPYVEFLTIWGKQVFREVIKAKTKGYVRAFSYDASLPPPPAAPGTTDTPMKAMAVWEPSETIPDYRRSFIPAISGGQGGCGCRSSTDGTDEPLTVTVVAKHKFIPLEFDLDFLPITSPSAVKLAMRSVMLQERGDDAGARTAMRGIWNPVLKRFEDGAIPLLEEQLDEFQGAGTSIILRRDMDALGGSAVQNFI